MHLIQIECVDSLFSADKYNLISRLGFDPGGRCIYMQRAAIKYLRETRPHLQDTGTSKEHSGGVMAAVSWRLLLIRHHISLETTFSHDIISDRSISVDDSPAPQGWEVDLYWAFYLRPFSGTCGKNQRIASKFIREIRWPEESLGRSYWRGR